MTTETELFEKTTDGKLPPQVIIASPDQLLRFPKLRIFTYHGEAHFEPQNDAISLEGNFILLPRGGKGVAIWFTEPALRVSFKYWIRGEGLVDVDAIKATFYDESHEPCGTVVVKTKAEDAYGTIESAPGKKIEAVIVASPSYSNAINHFDLTR